MRVVRRAAYQAHAVPSTAMAPRGPFPSEVMASNPVVYDDDTNDDPLPLGATAQNDYRGLRYLRCVSCDDIVREDQTAAHECGGTDGTD